MLLSELLSKISLKIIIIIAAAFVVAFGVLFSFSYFSNHEPSTIRMENSPYYDSSTDSVVLSNNTASLSTLGSCDVFASGPSKQIKYLTTVDCSSLSATEISKQDLLDAFGGQKGTYTLIINSQNKSTGRILQFSIG